MIGWLPLATPMPMENASILTNDWCPKSFRCFLTLSLSKAETKKSCKSVTKKRGDRNRDRRYRGDNVRCPVSQKPYALANKNLVHRVIKGIDDQSYDTWDGIPCQQPPHPFISKRIFHSCYFIHDTSSSYIHCFSNHLAKAKLLRFLTNRPKNNLLQAEQNVLAAIQFSFL